MKTSELRKYENIKSIAYYSGLGGVELKHIDYSNKDNDDYLIVQTTERNKKTIHRLKLYYCLKTDSSFIKLSGYTISLDKFIGEIPNKDFKGEYR